MYHNAGIEKCKPVIKKKKNNHDKTVSLAKSKLNSMEVIISKTLIDSNICHNEFVLISNVLKEFYDLKVETENFNNK